MKKNMLLNLNKKGETKKKFRKKLNLSTKSWAKTFLKKA